jgi:alginate O-acetyltransferase complex protein AlgI
MYYHFKNLANIHRSRGITVPFSSMIFLFFFLPITLILYHSGGRHLRNGILLLASLVFYAWAGIMAFPLLLVIVAGNFLFGLMLERLQSGWKRKTVLALGIVANLAPLYYFKYTGFLLQIFNQVIPNLHIQLYIPKEHDIPLGISFIAFHAISYLVDVSTNRAPGQKNPFRLGLYITFFPKVLSGPIQQYAEAVPQLFLRKVTLADFSIGVERFIIGLGKKLLLANALAEIADPIFQAPSADLSVGIAWLGAVCYTLQIYFDFSGYTDMAVGLGYMFGFRLPENFNYPYLAQSVQEFWQRWHITLSQWFRTYLYIPLGGNRRGNVRTYFNLCTVFLLCGFWHGASWNFIVWGLLHGFFLMLERWRLAVLLARLPKIVRHLYLLLFILVSWVFFRATTLEGACSYLEAMLGYGTIPQANPWIYLKLDGQIALVAVLSSIFAFPFVPFLADSVHRFTVTRMHQEKLFFTLFSSVKIISLSTLFLLALMELASGTYNPFIYFRF